MPLRHLRQNAVAYLALAIALGTGTAYAADQLAANSVGTKQLTKNSVISSKIKKGQVKRGDIQRGVLPDDGEVLTEMISAPSQTTTPDLTGQQAKTFTLKGSGAAYLRYAAAGFGMNCSSGTGQIALQLDGNSVANTLLDVATTADPDPVELVGTATLGAGQHVVSISYDCPTGNYTSGTIANATWSIIRLPH